jgi:preprotein translocase subunit SecA
MTGGERLAAVDAELAAIKERQRKLNARKRLLELEKRALEAEQVVERQREQIEQQRQQIKDLGAARVTALASAVEAEQVAAADLEPGRKRLRTVPVSEHAPEASSASP